MSKKSLIASILTFALIFSFGFIFWTYNIVSAHGDNDKDSVDDVDKVDVEKLPPSFGKFQLKGIITAVNASGSTFAVNGLNINIAVDAKIRKGNLKALGDLAVDDRVEVSGKVENAVLTADKIRVKGQKKTGTVVGGVTVGLEAVNKLRNDLQSRIADILKKIEDLQKRINDKLGQAAPPVSTSTPSSGGQATSTP